MKYYVVSLLALFPLLTLQTPRALAHGFARGGHFASRRVIIINPSHARFVHHVNFIVPRHQFVLEPGNHSGAFFLFSSRHRLYKPRGFFRSSASV